MSIEELPPKRERKYFYEHIEIDGKRGHWIWHGPMANGKTPSMNIKNNTGNYTSTSVLRWTIRHKSDETLPDGPVYRECDESRCVAPKHAHLPAREPLTINPRIRIWESDCPDVAKVPDAVLRTEIGEPVEYNVGPEEQTVGIDLCPMSRSGIIYVYSQDGDQWTLWWSIRIARGFYEKPFTDKFAGKLMFLVQ